MPHEPPVRRLLGAPGVTGTTGAAMVAVTMDGMAAAGALYPAGDRVDKRARARRRADDAVRDGLAA